MDGGSSLACGFPRTYHERHWPSRSSSPRRTSQAKDIRDAVGRRYGTILPAEGHLFELVEPVDVDPAWKRWSAVLLRPMASTPLNPPTAVTRRPKLQAIRDALKTAKRVWLATDCDREGQLIGQEILEHYGYKGEVRRVMFTAQDAQTIREAFTRARPNSDHLALYQAAVARRQADQIYNLSLTRTATVTLAQGARTVIGVGRVKTPTMAIVCRRELEIREFVVEPYFEVVATATVTDGQFRMRQRFKGAHLRPGGGRGDRDPGRRCHWAVDSQSRGETPGTAAATRPTPRWQKLCASRFGWSAAHTLAVAQELYDGAGKKIITLPAGGNPLPAPKLDPADTADRRRAAGRPKLCVDPGAGPAADPARDSWHLQ